MANPLTGDFEAVLQISGNTLNRLLATMHQNPIAKPNLPTFPHSPTLRIGDKRAADGVRGSVKVQIGVPRIELFHGVSDRFLIEVAIRARYKPDPQTKPLPEFIHGTVRAEYRIQDISPECPGWSKKAPDYLWIRVIPESVKFSGTAFDDARPWLQTEIAGGDDIEAHITKQITRQLATTFAPGPHPVGKRFRRGSMRSLNTPGSDSAVCLPLGISGEPAGAITSISNLFLNGRDVAIAISRETILNLINPAVTAIGSYTTTVHIHVSTPWPMPDIDTVYRGRMNPPTVEWHPQGNHAIIKIKASGSARTDSILADATFDIVQDIVVNFDGGAESLWLSPGHHNVTVHSSGLGHGTVANAVKNAVSSAVKSMVQSVCAQAQPELNNMIARKHELIDQLRTIDDMPFALFDQADFLNDGMVLRGVISVSPRQQAVLRFDETLEEDGYTAFLSWIPGGRIDQLVWTWSWFSATKPGSATLNDRYILRRPKGGKTTHWGGMIGFPETTPLPGLDGMGTLCLTIKGVTVDRYTGAFVPFVSRKQCSRYGYPIDVEFYEGTGSLYFRDWPHETQLLQDEPFRELGILNIAKRADTASAANTLLVYVDRAWDREIASAIQEGLEHSRRRDAGLQVLVLFREGTLTQGLASKVEGMVSSIGAPVVVNEDVRESWSRRYDIPIASGEIAWRLLSPGGGVTWIHNGRLHGEALARNLDQALVPSRAPKPRPLRSAPAIGIQVAADALRPVTLDSIEADTESPCPTMPLNKVAEGSVIAFVQIGSHSSQTALRELNERYRHDREGRPMVTVVVEGSDARATEALRRELDLDFTVLPDLKGTISRRFGVQMWPTTVSLDPEGVVHEVLFGRRAEPASSDEGRTPAYD